ncbi:MAG: single-stranded DNA-binding protein [Actinobacteria bacterium]|nr:single-stranded DNA-binding protein [Actinomycetota bacterium]
MGTTTEQPDTATPTGSGASDDGVQHLPANLVVLAGVLSSDPRPLELASGDTLLRYEVTVRNDGDRAETVPVVRFDPMASERGLTAGAPVVVVGRIRRRYFQAGGSTVSRTEVVADRVVSARRRVQARRAVERALARLPWSAQGRQSGPADPTRAA